MGRQRNFVEFLPYEWKAAEGARRATDLGSEPARIDRLRHIVNQRAGFRQCSRYTVGDILDEVNDYSVLTRLLRFIAMLDVSVDAAIQSAGNSAHCLCDSLVDLRQAA